jgi:hypothetical protein
MYPSQEIPDLKKSDSKDSKEIKHKHVLESPATHLKNSSSPKDIRRSLQLSNERDLNSDFSLPFRDIYDYHIKEIEKKTNIKIKHIYIFINSFFIFYDWPFRADFFVYNNWIFSYYMDKRRL